MAGSQTDPVMAGSQTDPVMAGSQTSQPAAVSPMAVLFPDSKACRLQFMYASRTETDHEDIFVSQLEKEGKMEKLEELGKSFRVTDITVDTPNQVIVVRKKGRSTEELGQKWADDVRQKIKDVLGEVQSQVIQLGLASEDAHRHVRDTLSGGKLSCLLSHDRQSILLLSSDPKEVARARKLVVNKAKETLAAAPVTGSDKTILPSTVTTPLLTQQPTQVTPATVSSSPSPTPARLAPGPRSPGPTMSVQYGGLTKPQYTVASTPVQQAPVHINPQISKVQSSQSIAASSPSSRQTPPVPSPSTGGSQTPSTPVAVVAGDVQKISEVEAKLLQTTAVKAEFLSLLMTNEIIIATDQICNGIIKVKHGNSKDVKKVLNSLLCMVVLSCQKEDNEVQSKLKQLSEKYPGQVESQYDENKAVLHIAYCGDISADVEPVLDALKTVQRNISIPTHKAGFLRSRLQAMRNHIQTSFSPPVKINLATVKINLATDTNNKPVLKVSSDRADYPAVEKTVLQLLSEIVQKEEELDVVLAMFLQGVRGQAVVESLKKTSDCQIEVRSVGHRMLWRARSDKGHQLVVWEGKLAACDCEVILLPLQEGQTGWPAQHKHILQRSFLESSSEVYASEVGLSPQPRSMSLLCNTGASEQSNEIDIFKMIEIMFVPTGQALMRNIQEACKEIFLKLNNLGVKSIAIPIPLCASVSSVDSLSAMLPAIERSLEKWKEACTVMFYLDPLKAAPTESQQLVQTLQRTALRPWKTDTDYSSSFPHEAHGMTSTKPAVVVCGRTKDVDASIAQIQMLGVPEDFRRHAMLLLDFLRTHPPSSLQGGQRSYVSDELIPSLFTFGIPKSCMDEDRMDTLKNLALERKATSSTVQFSMQNENLHPFLEKVLSFLSEHGQREGHSAASGTSPQPSPQVAAEDGLIKELSPAQFEALKVLMREEFDKNIHVMEKTKETVKISCRGPAGKETMSKIESLREETVQLSNSQELEKVPEPIDATNEGLAAYMVPIHKELRVVIFTLDYHALAKAKHLLNVKLGKVKITKRAERRVEGSTGGSTGLPSPSSPTPLPLSTSPAQTADFTTKSGIRVSVYKTDITKLRVDAIVNAANERLSHGGGVAYAISRAAGFELEDEGQQHISRNGPLRVREVVATTAGSLPCRAVLHAVGPRWTDYTDKALCAQHLADTVYNCLDKASSMKFTSLAIPSISSAIFGVPRDVCAQSYLSAVQNFDKHCGGTTCLKQVHFVDVSDSMVSAIQETFTRCWNLDVPTVQMPSQQESSPASAAMMSAPGSALASVSSVGSASGGLDTSRPSPGPSATAGSVRRDERPLPMVKFDSESRKTGDQSYSFSFEGLNLDLLFRCGKICDGQTDAFLLWQEEGKVGRDVNSRKIQGHLIESDKAKVTVLADSMKSVGSVNVAHTSFASLIFVRVAPNSTPSAEEIQSWVGQTLQRVDEVGKRSVTIPVYPQKPKNNEVSRKAVADFAVGIYSAARDYASKPQRSVTEINIICEDQDMTKFLCNTVQERLAVDQSMLDSQQGAGPQRENTRQHEASSENNCAICLENKMTNPESLPCGHTFCSACIDDWLKRKPTCPSCNKIHGTLTGKQPPGGRMEMRYSHANLPGCGGSGSFTIEYFIPGGVQTEEHPEPGKQYSGTGRTAYLPNTDKGRKVLMLLKTAFDRRLIFTIGLSVTNNTVGIVWNDIHHKTSMSRGEYSYPDHTYLDRVLGELADKGVTEKDLTSKQKAFIQNPFAYNFNRYMDFSGQFS